MLLIYINKQVLVSTSGSVIHGRCTPVLSDIPDKSQGSEKDGNKPTPTQMNNVEHYITQFFLPV